MNDFEGVKRNAAQTFSNVVRSSSSAEKLDPQQMLLVMTQVLNPIQDGQALDLTPVEEFLKKEKGLSPSEVEEIFIFYQSREDKVGMQILLPISMNNIPEARRMKIIERFDKKPQQATYSGAKDATGTTQTHRVETVYDKRRPADGEAAKLKKIKLALATVFLIGGGAFGASEWLNQPPPPRDINLAKTEDSINCTKLTINRGNAFCILNSAELLRWSPEERKRRGETLMDQLAVEGVKKIFYRDERNKPVGL